MNRRALFASALVTAMLAGAGVYCAPTKVPNHPIADSPAVQPAATLPGMKSCVFENKDAGIRFNYPAGWTPAKGQTTLMQMNAPAGKGQASLNLDVPKLPFHLPGMIPLGAVVQGYIDDQKKNDLQDMKVEQSNLTVAGVPARRVKLSGQHTGKHAIDQAVILVHNDKVYILSADSDDTGYPLARAALDAAISSVAWLK